MAVGFGAGPYNPYKLGATKYRGINHLRPVDLDEERSADPALSFGAHLLGAKPRNGSVSSAARAAGENILGAVTAGMRERKYRQREQQANEQVRKLFGPMQYEGGDDPGAAGAQMAAAAGPVDPLARAMQRYEASPEDQRNPDVERYLQGLQMQQMLSGEDAAKPYYEKYTGNARNYAIAKGADLTPEELNRIALLGKSVTNVTTNVHQPLKPGDLQPYIEDAAMISTIDDLIADLEKNPDAIGLVKGTASTGGTLSNTAVNWLDPEGVDIRARVANIGSSIIKDRSGANVTVSEFPRLRPFVPLPTDSAATAKTKLKGLQKELQAMARAGAIILEQSGYAVPDAVKGASQASNADAPGDMDAQAEALIKQYGGK